MDEKHQDVSKGIIQGSTTTQLETYASHTPHGLDKVNLFMALVCGDCAIVDTCYKVV